MNFPMMMAGLWVAPWLAPFFDVMWMTKAGSIDALVKGVPITYGRIDALVNSAGIVADAQLKEMTDEQFD